MDKTCSKCGETKEVVDGFYKLTSKTKAGDTSYGTYCKACMKIRNKANYKKDKWRDYYLDNKERYDDYQYDYYKKNKEKIDIRCKAYNKAHPDKMYENSLRWRNENKEKSRAHAAMWNAIRNGSLIKLEVCECCGRVEDDTTIIDGHHHHDNYVEKPLDILWLCRSCHRRYHCGNTETSAKLDILYEEKFGS